mmetsp:Transcript_5350/g.10983  ORF Transcript_5350/g.10983 Transcript_5350/m.10983 type:complete len:84 (+) Transcript_5350:900-1151(+)
MERFGMVLGKIVRVIGQEGVSGCIMSQQKFVLRRKQQKVNFGRFIYLTILFAMKMRRVLIYQRETFLWCGGQHDDFKIPLCNP